ncbi:MAG: flagellar protein [Lachnospiraceae bacterium]|nr:flagellar protein [Lachnospiraceae bacterium]
MERLRGSFLSIDQMADAYMQSSHKVGHKEQVNEQGLSFQQILEQTNDKQTNNVTFSKHANERLSSRNISLDANQMERLNKGIMQAKEKSINESLVMMDNIAFIVNVKNNTVVTAMDQTTNDSNIFTNIDGAVIV